MFDVSGTPTTLKTTHAAGLVYCSVAGIQYLEKQGTVALFERCRMSASLAVRQCALLFPMLPAATVEALDLQVEFLDSEKHHDLLPEAAFTRTGLLLLLTLKSIGTSPIEAEAMAAISCAAIVLRDAIRGIDEDVEISGLRILKSKEKSQRKKYFSSPPVCAILVCSDSAAEGKRSDKSGRLIKEILEEQRAEVRYYEVVPDDKEQIQSRIRTWISEDIHFIFTTGGTGLGSGDQAVNAVRELIERDADGITDAMRSYGQRRSPLAMMSRMAAGSAGHSLLITLPGSSAGARESLEAILPALFHARKMMRSGDH